ncbi:PBP1b-binding outer membrane lipoprotein LpoB [Lelliottia sp. 489]
MKKTGYISLVIAAFLLQGCVNIGTSKSVSIPVNPSQKSMLVTSTATVHCKDYFIFFKCNIDVNTQSM